MTLESTMTMERQQPVAVRSSDLLDISAIPRTKMKDILEPELAELCEDAEPLHHTMAVMSSSKDMTWPTPQEWYDYLNLEFGFTLDPCCQHETAKCKKHYTPAEDGLKQSWANERVFMNPPYGREIGPWMKKAYTEARDNGALVVCFVPARVDTNWWHSYATKATEIRYPKGRVKNPDGAAWPFPIAVVIYRPKL